MQRAGEAENRRSLALVENALRLCSIQGRADIDERLGHHGKTDLGRPVQDRDLVVGLEHAVTVVGKDPAYAAHAEGVQFGRAQCAHAGGTEDVDALRHRPEYLLVPDWQHAIEHPVDQSDALGPATCRAQHVTDGGRRLHPGVDAGTDRRGGHGRPGEHDHAHATRAASARGPGA